MNRQRGVPGLVLFVAIAVACVFLAVISSPWWAGPAALWGLAAGLRSANVIDGIYG